MVDTGTGLGQKFVWILVKNFRAAMGQCLASITEKSSLAIRMNKNFRLFVFVPVHFEKHLRTPFFHRTPPSDCFCFMTVWKPARMLKVLMSFLIFHWSLNVMHRT